MVGMQCNLSLLSENLSLQCQVVFSTGLFHFVGSQVFANHFWHHLFTVVAHCFRSGVLSAS